MRGMLGLATALLFAAAPAFAQYEVVQGFDDLPPKGPGSALGIVIWNHGLSGNNDQARFPPPTYMRSLHAAGWDVIRIKRDGLSEGGGWTTGGLRHVARTVEEVQRAKAQGYARVILAGQSYGGSITLETARRIEVYAIIPSAPGTGVSLNLVGTVQADTAGTNHLYAALEDGKFERAAPILPFSDEFALASPERGTRSREILAKRGVPFLALDDRSTILTGHGGSSSSAMTQIYAPCLVAFLDPTRVPAAGAAACGRDGLTAAPDLMAEAASLKPAALPAGEWWKFYEGIWVGAWGGPNLAAVTLEKAANGYELVYLMSARGSNKLDRTHRVPARLDGRNVVAELPHQKVTLEHDQRTRQTLLRWADGKGGTGALLMRSYAPREPGS
ncbi:MAG: alpha/beta hydrolase [Telmatospirillum sp.]|nr:alpha/beta hydrolase [Telmatospirillum sp.]